ncbi:MAG: VOC family protein [Crocinitomicaceae bacterium]
MKRKQFLVNILGTTALLSMDGFSSLAGALAQNNETQTNSSKEIATFGAVHLNNTNLVKSIDFWTTIVGMRLRKLEAKKAEFGTEKETMVVVHESAKKRFQKTYSGLYHFAIHAPNEPEFANMIHRLNKNKYPYSPIDHTMSKSIYLDDPDGINVEFTLETPERFKRVITEKGIAMEGTDGVIRPASARLDLEESMRHLKDTNIFKVISDDTKIGHFHLYANNVDASNEFYKKIGFAKFNYMPEYLYADVGAGGDYKHRIAMNSWHGINRPLAPKENAGMRHFHIIFKSDDTLKQGIANISDAQLKDGGYWLTDPTGNKIFATSV